MSKLTAVLMGDIVGSRHASDTKKLHHSFNAAVDRANKLFSRDVISPLTITLGDEFQGLVHSLSTGFEIAQDMRMELLKKGVKSRFVVGLARIETKINTKQAWNMLGPGLSEARERLNDKEDFSCYRFAMSSVGKEFEVLLDAIGRSLTKVENEWTDTQTSYVLHALDSHKTKAAISQDLAISKNTLFKVLRSASFQFYLQQRDAIANVLKELDARLKFERE